MEKTSGLTKTCASLWSPLVSLGFLSDILPLCFSHLIISWEDFPKHFFYKIIIIINWKVKIFMWLELTSPLTQSHIWAQIFSPFMEVETWGDLWSVQDFSHASIIIDQN